MIWHLFKKDWRRLWPIVLGLALADLLYAIIDVLLGPFSNYPMLAQIEPLLDLLISGLVFFLAAAVVQLDPVPDDRQDWLVRPIRRSDLLLSKLLFVIVCIHGPMFAATLCQGLASGLAPGQAIGSALAWNAYRFANVSTTRFPGTLAALVIGVATQSIGQMLALVLVAGGGTFLVVMGVLFGIPGLNTGVSRYQWSLAQWGTSLLILLAGGAAVLALQYFRRATRASWIVIGAGGLLLWLNCLLLPQSTALAVQGWFSSAPGRGVSIAFAPELPKQHVSAMDGGRAGFLIADGYMPIYLPLRIADISPGVTLMGEDIRATFTAADGTHDIAIPIVLNKPLYIPGQAGAPAPLYQVVWVSPDFARKYADEPVRVDIDVTFAILRPLSTYEMAPARGVLKTPEGLSCATRNNVNRGIQLACLQPGNQSVRVSAALLDRASGLRNPTLTRFQYSDAPYSSEDDPIAKFGFNLPFRDAATGAAYPVGPAQLTTSSVAVTTSQPLTHFMRRITIPSLRLTDWKADVPVTGP